MKKQKIEDIFSSMENFSSVPPPELWNKIEEELDKPKKKKRAILWWSAAACLLLGLLLPSVLRFNSDSGIETINKESIEKNVVLDENKQNAESNKKIGTEENNAEKKADVVENSSLENTVKESNNPQNNNPYRTTITPKNFSTKINSGISDQKSKNTTKNTNQAVAEKTFTAGKQNSFNSFSNNQALKAEKRNENQDLAEKTFTAGKQNSFNSFSNNQALQTEKRNKNQAVAEKTFTAGKQNSFNSFSNNEALQAEKRNEIQPVAEKTFTTGKQNSFNSFSNNQALQTEKRNENQAVAEKTFTTGKQNSSNSYSNNEALQAEKRNENQAVAEKTFTTGKQNSFNSYSNNQALQTEKRNENQAVAEKTFTAGKQNSFNSFSNNEALQAEKRNENQAVAEKTFTAGKQNSFNSFSNNQVPNSIFEEKLASKNNAVTVLNSSNLISEKKQNTTKEVSNEALTTKTIVAENNQNKNSEYTNLLTKVDSLQLVELQNLEKGIVEVKTEKDKESKSIPNSEKWSLDVFAGVANSQNYGKQKTLGNVNESKQTNSYGVKTNYKLNKKWAVSSGLKINELGQSIANVSYYQTSEIASYPAISDYLIQSPAVVAPKITTNSSYVFVSKNTQNALKSDNTENGNIEQSLKYIEMPLEVSYAIFSKSKTSLSLNTGGFVGKLISNNVTLNGDSIGDNLNASDFVYGTLLSSTLQYRLYKKTNVFVQPGMNYYINPLTKQTFNQFQWAFNFGLNVSF
ncbi:hypothetical protein [Flavobacterium salmonis]|uniref:Outer membrane protein beta-barrel domain-containing protein n=1 Tax=Flavobacterium salmonis TaxID=2654844 RepID=A0A6V6Z099_9FLAO|nr:hypothetical protein [Flavobacterium salmonis]CAD0005105.1 hypothetical protein FLAT13_02583 [Flavobacterium salmonis]